jgi:formate dehydrogenase subunit delta
VSSTQHLARMANDIANFFRGQSDREDAIAGITKHLRSFWTPRMREKLIARLDCGEEELDELPREALRRIVEHPNDISQEPPGGDAG